MKTILRSSLLLLCSTALCLSAFALDQAELSESTPVITPAPSETMDRMKDATFEQRDEFALMVKNVGAQSDTAVAELNTGYAEMLASPARRAAMDALKKAAANFKEKAAALDNVSADTWETVKSNIVTASGNLESALAKARTLKA